MSLYNSWIDGRACFSLLSIYTNYYIWYKLYMLNNRDANFMICMQICVIWSNYNTRAAHTLRVIISTPHSIPTTTEAYIHQHSRESLQLSYEVFMTAYGRWLLSALHLISSFSPRLNMSNDTITVITAQLPISAVAHYTCWLLLLWSVTRHVGNSVSSGQIYEDITLDLIGIFYNLISCLYYWIIDNKPTVEVDYNCVLQCWQ